MNLKIALAAALLLTGTAYVSNAQSKPAATKTTTTVTSKTFLSKVGEFEKTTDAAKSASLLDELNQQMGTGLAGAKAEMAGVSDEAARNTLMKKYQARMTTITQIRKLSADIPANKSGIVSALKQYAATL